MQVFDSDEALKIIENYLEVMKNAISSNITTTGRKASGRTAKSLQVEMSEVGGRIVGRQYFQGLEVGRPKGKVPYNFRNIIKQWIIDKGIDVDNIDQSAYLIARKIREKGTNMWYHHEYNVYTPVIDIYERKMLEEVMGVVTKDLSAEIKRQFKNG